MENKIVDQVLSKLKSFDWSRRKIELISAVVIVLLGLVVLTVPVKSQGTLTFNKGKITYTGEIVNYRMTGTGKLVYENGDVYEGGFDRGVFEGKGKFTSHQGWTYEGHFSKGLADGEGTLTTKAKKVYKGTFKQGIYQQ
ncbi:hypothetical protein [Streptococcus plurextorum]|uniref:hypothetical protein n=1 Tax=Streptococcus plurextorum TaxID=456876 RepID=UPI0004149C83|nr:hypothetical protein [Streptococcus plurextorum]